jgi:PAS domain S-box-containing protein
MARDPHLERAILDSLSFPITTVGPDGTLLHVNAAAAKNLSGTLASVVGRSLYEFFPEREAATRERLRQTVDRREPQRFEARVTLPNGDERYFESVYYPMFDDAGVVTAVQIVAQDVTALRRAELARKESRDPWGLVTDDLSMTHERLQAILETAPIVIGVHDRDMTIRYMNWVAEGADISQVIGSSPLSWIREEDHHATRAAFAKALDTQEVAECRVHDIWGNEWLMRLAPLLHEGEVKQVLSCTLDVTEQSRLQRQLWQKQKIESLGTMAGGIAHDFNNLLAAILGNAGLARRWLDMERDPSAFLDNINDASRKAAELCKQMLWYAGHGQASLVPGNLNDVIEEMARLTRAAVSSKIETTYELAPDLPPIHGHLTQLGQVVLNLMSNAADAIGDAHGTITITTDTMLVGDEALGHFLPKAPSPGRHVRLRVTDTGAGIDAKNLSNIFDPFYTTKSSGHGLGLSAVLGIVSAHGAVIEVESKHGVGTTMTVLFPVLDGAAVSEESAPVDPGWFPGRGTVMVVDDEVAVRQMAATVLAEAGYQVTEARDGDEALTMLRARDGAIRAVVLDVTMPKRDGYSTLEEIRKQHPDLPVLLSSGKLTEVRVCPAETRVHVLRKPYTPAELTTAIAKCFAGADGSD